MATRYNNRKIILSEQTLPMGKLLSGMIVTFNYSEKGVTDPRPIILFLHHEKKLIVIPFFSPEFMCLYISDDDI